MKLYITGSVGSGKSTLARKIGEMGLPCFELDAVAYEPDPDNPGDNRKRPETVRDAIFAEILARESWVWTVFRGLPRARAASSTLFSSRKYRTETFR